MGWASSPDGLEQIYVMTLEVKRSGKCHMKSTEIISQHLREAE